MCGCLSLLSIVILHRLILNCNRLVLVVDYVASSVDIHVANSPDVFILQHQLAHVYHFALGTFVYHLCHSDLLKMYLTQELLNI